jgi:hypothetical protein
MNYSSGDNVRLGDKVRIDGTMVGVVVANVEAGIFSNNFPAEEWSYLSEGILVETVEVGLIHFPYETNEIELLSREDRNV